MRERLPLVISATALAVALLGSTPLGHAAGSALAKGVPFAEKAGFASNAGKLNGHKSSTKPKAGQIPVVGSNGKLPASLGTTGTAGVQGPAGPAGAQGPPGVSGYEVNQSQPKVISGGDKSAVRAQCSSGKSVFGGGYISSKDDVQGVDTYPTANNTEWTVFVYNVTNGATTVTAYAVCGKVG